MIRAYILAGLAVVAASVLGCATRNSGVGIVDDRTESLHRFIEQEASLLAVPASETISHVFYYVSHGVTEPVSWLDPQVSRVSCLGSDVGPAASIVSIVGRGAWNSNFATVFEHRHFESGSVCTSVLVVVWCERARRWEVVMRDDRIESL